MSTQQPHTRTIIAEDNWRFDDTDSIEALIEAGFRATFGSRFPHHAKVRVVLTTDSQNPEVDIHVTTTERQTL
jgi:hypothetical protein